MIKVLVSAGLVSILSLIIFFYWAMTPCDMNREYSMSRVLKHLSSVGLDSKYLKEDRIHDEACVLAYIYKSESENIHFKVIEGHKVTWWDVNERGPLY